MDASDAVIVASSSQPDNDQDGDTNIEVHLSNREVLNLFQVRQVDSDPESEEKYDIKNLSLVDNFDSQVEIV